MARSWFGHLDPTTSRRFCLGKDGSGDVRGHTYGWNIDREGSPIFLLIQSLKLDEWFVLYHLVIVYACMSQHVKGDILARPCLKEISHLHERHGIALFPFLSSESFSAPPPMPFLCQGNEALGDSGDTSVWLHNWVVAFKYVLFSSLFGKDFSNLANIFQLGWNHQPDNHFKASYFLAAKDGLWILRELDPIGTAISHGLQAALPSASTPAFNFDLLLLGSWIWKGKRNIRKDVNQIVRICFVS